MAYEALDNLQQTLDQILEYHDNLLTPIKQEIISIRIQAVVLQLNVKHYPNKETITEAANSTHEIIEYLFSEENVPDGESIDPTVRLANRLRELALRLESTVGDVVDYIKGKASVSSITDSPAVSSSSSRSAITSSEDDFVVGVDKDVKVIINRLLEGSTRLRVLPIVGTGGIGKTTLAKIVYNDDSFIRLHLSTFACNHASAGKKFDICAWVTISQDHSVERIVQNLLASIKEISALRDAKSDIPIETLICEYLKGRRYLIVMDDMWSKKAWDDVKMLFPDVGNGSRIIVTTRLHDVAAYVDSCRSIHTMSLLDAHHSWNLLKQKVFGDEDIPIELEDIGKKIVQNCGGLPLSIVVVAGLLSKIPIHTRSSWKQIAANGGQLETIIGLSYTHLPNHLKLCLLYMAGFPEDKEIRVTELVNLWISEGFVTLSNGSKSLEEEAEDCLKDLVERSLVLVTNRKFDGKIKSCSLHDIVREFCVRKAAKEKVILSTMDYLPTPILRRHFVPRLIKDHHSISASSYDLHLKDYVHSSHVRTIICIPKKGYRSDGVVEKFSSLRVLHVLRRSDYWDWEPGQVFDLVHLTYLASNIPNSIVPSAISKLQNLQTLIIYRSEVRLPTKIWRLRQLRHLIAFSFQPLPSPEWEQNPLDNLQALSLATDLVCNKRMVEMIPNIKKLGICYSKEKFDADVGYCLQNLKFFCLLEKLKLEKHDDFSCRQLDELGLEMRGGFSSRQLDELGFMMRGVSSSGQLDELRLEMRGGFSSRQFDEIGGLNFPLQLRRLTLSGWRLSWSHMKIIGSLPNLQVLKLRNYACQGSIWITTEGEFRELRLLLIDRSDLVDWITEASHFPRLECLILRQCHDRFMIPSNIGYIPTLKLIEVEKGFMGRLLSSAEGIEEKQRNSGNDSFKVRVKHSGYTDRSFSGQVHSLNGNLEQNVNENKTQHDASSEDILVAAVEADGLAHATSELPAPEKLLSVPEGHINLHSGMMMEVSPGDFEGLDEGDAGSKTAAGRKRTFTESTLTEQSLNSVESSREVRIKRTTGSVPDDDDLLSSILVGRNSSILRVKPTPPSEVTSMKRHRTAPRSGAPKRKLLMDDTMVLHGDAIRQQLTNAGDIRRVRKKAPCTLSEISMIRKQHMGDETFLEPVFTGMSVELASLHSCVYDLGRIKVCQNEVHDACLQTVIELGQPSQNDDNGNLPETVVEFHPTSPAIRSHDMDDHEGPGKTNAIEVGGQDLNNEFLTVRENETAEPCENHLPNENKIEEVDYRSVPVNEEWTKPTTDVGTDDLHKEHMLDAALIDSGATSDMLQSEGTNAYAEKDSAVVLDQREAVPSAELDFAEVDHEQAMGNEGKDKDGYGSESETVLREKDYILPEMTQDPAAELIPGADHGGSEYHVQDEYGTTSKEQLDLEFPCTGFESMLEGGSMNKYEDTGHPEAYQLHMMDGEISGFDLHDRDELNYLAEGNDTEFLNVDDDDLADMDDDYMPDAEDTRHNENTGWSSRTRAVSKYLQSAFLKEAECGRNALSLDNLLIGKSRKEASRMFFETLVLKTRDYIHVEERIPFGDITIRPRTRLIKSDF